MTASYNAINTSLVRVSTDALHWKNYPILGADAWELSRKFIDISDAAAGKPMVYVQFWREGNEDNAIWSIDDVMLTDEAPKHPLIFLVDMSKETVSPKGVHIAHNLNGWNPKATEMTAIGNGIYIAQIDNVPEAMEFRYKFINGDSWSENESVPQTCGIMNAAGFYDRGITQHSNELGFGPYCFGQCTSCIYRTPKSSYMYCPKDTDVIYCDNFESYDNNAQLTLQNTNWLTSNSVKQGIGAVDDGGRIVGYWNGHTNYDGVKALFMRDFYSNNGNEDGITNKLLFDLKNPITGKFEVTFKFLNAKKNPGSFSTFSGFSFLDNTRSGNEFFLFYIFNNGIDTFSQDGNLVELAKVMDNKWHDMSFVFDVDKRLLTATLDGTKIAESVAPDGLRFDNIIFIEGEDGMYIDDFIYRRIPKTRLFAQIKPGKILIEPNPAQNFVTINIDSKNDEVWSTRLTNQLGQTMFSKIGQYNTGFDIDVSAFPNGLYIVEYQSGTEKKIEKVVVQH